MWLAVVVVLLLEILSGRGGPHSQDANERGEKRVLLRRLWSRCLGCFLRPVPSPFAAQPPSLKWPWNFSIPYP